MTCCRLAVCCLRCTANLAEGKLPFADIPAPYVQLFKQLAAKNVPTPTSAPITLPGGAVVGTALTMPSGNGTSVRITVSSKGPLATGLMEAVASPGAVQRSNSHDPSSTHHTRYPHEHEHKASTQYAQYPPPAKRKRHNMTHTHDLGHSNAAAAHPELEPLLRRHARPHPGMHRRPSDNLHDSTFTASYGDRDKDHSRPWGTASWDRDHGNAEEDRERYADVPRGANNDSPPPLVPLHAERRTQGWVV